jgi:HptB-dependent secretion and biofilm anti anti-sigma factor
MSITSDDEGTHWTVRLSGRFDFSCRDDFRAAYAASPTGSNFVIDMSAVEYVDSAALGMLLLLRDHAGDATRVTIRGSRGQPEQVLRIANFHKLFRLD